MKPPINSAEESALLSKMDRLLKLQNAATQLELLIRKTRDLDAKRMSNEKIRHEHNKSSI